MRLNTQLFLTVLCVFALHCAVSVQAQTLHVFIIAETNATNVGAPADYTNMQREVQDIARLSGMQLKTYKYEKQNLSPNTLVSAITSLRCQPNDAIWFYYTGHGLNPGNGSAFSAFKVGNSKFTMDKVHQKLKAKNPRLLITMFDCCNHHVTRVPGLAARSGRISINYATLFKLAKGEVKVTSSKAGQYSYGNGRAGGVFTNQFLAALHEVAGGNNNSCNWNKVMARTKQLTQNSATQVGRSQVPHYTVSQTGGTSASVNATPGYVDPNTLKDPFD